jgi:hypothetical protein
VGEHDCIPSSTPITLFDVRLARTKDRLDNYHNRMLAVIIVILQAG